MTARGRLRGQQRQQRRRHAARTNPTPPTTRRRSRRRRSRSRRPGVNPQRITVSPGTRVTFINNDSRTHEMNSDPHPNHGDCPPIDDVGFLSPGQTKQTGNLTVGADLRLSRSQSAGRSRRCRGRSSCSRPRPSLAAALNKRRSARNCGFASRGWRQSPPGRRRSRTAAAAARARARVRPRGSSPALTARRA